MQYMTILRLIVYSYYSVFPLNLNASSKTGAANYFIHIQLTKKEVLTRVVSFHCRGLLGNKDGYNRPVIPK